MRVGGVAEGCDPGGPGLILGSMSTASYAVEGIFDRVSLTILRQRASACPTSRDASGAGGSGATRVLMVGLVRSGWPSTSSGDQVVEMRVADRIGNPPQADDVRSLVHDRLKEAELENGEKVTVEYRGSQKHLYVITMPVDMLYFNPDTHRVRAQRTIDPQRDAMLASEPWSGGAQAYLKDLLSWRPSAPGQIDPDYEQLKDELRAFGQREPGVITREGILANGNTRCAALRDLGVPDIRVGVLPESSTWDDINRVELSLQLRRDKRRDYSYVNRLITIEEQITIGRKEEDVARDFNVKTATLQKDRWVYALIKDAIERSKTSNGAALALADFEEHQEKLRELSRDYFKLKITNPDAAERLKESRLQMVVLNYAKTSLRLADEDFHTEFLQPRLPAPLRSSQGAAAVVQIPGLPGVEVSDASAATKEATAITDALLRASAVQKSADAAADTAELSESAEVLKSARDTYEKAVELAGRNALLKKKQSAVPDRLSDATEYVNQAVSEFANARATGMLDEEAFDDALTSLAESLSKLARQAARAFDSPGDGVAWLLATTSSESDRV